MVPSLITAQVCSKPAPTPDAPATPATATSADESLIVPSPSCPKLFRPVHCSDWSDRSTHVCHPPDEAALIAAPVCAENCTVPPTSLVGFSGLMPTVPAPRK